MLFRWRAVVVVVALFMHIKKVIFMTISSPIPSLQPSMHTNRLFIMQFICVICVMSGSFFPCYIHREKDTRWKPNGKSVVIIFQTNHNIMHSSIHTIHIRFPKRKKIKISFCFIKLSYCIAFTGKDVFLSTETYATNGDFLLPTRRHGRIFDASIVQVIFGYSSL